MTRKKPAVFLDRDGVVIEEANYLHTIDQVRLIPGTAETIAALNRADWLTVLVTNQSGVARGLYPIECVATVHQHLLELFQGYGARFDGVYFCPHHPGGDLAEYCRECECRKPRPGMLLQAAADLEIDLARSWMIGDRLTDLEAGAAAGCRTALVRTGYGKLVNAAALDREALHLELIASDLPEAVAKLGLLSARAVA